MKKLLLTAAAFLLACPAFADVRRPDGFWKLTDSKGNPKSVIRVFPQGKNTYGAMIVQYYTDTKAVCSACTDENKNKPINGLVFMQGLKTTDGVTFSGGKILDPDTGKISKAKMVVKADGRHLVINSYGLLGSWFGSSDVWVRDQ